jgi:hypothetical protein
MLAALACTLLTTVVVLAQDTPPPAPAAPKPALAGPTATMLEEIKIVVDDKAKGDGEIRFLFTPQGGEAKEVRVVIQKGMNKQAVCRDIAKELSVGLGDKYKVDQYDDDKVKVAGKSGAKFGLSLAAQSVPGISVQLK